MSVRSNLLDLPYTQVAGFDVREPLKKEQTDVWILQVLEGFSAT